MNTSFVLYGATGYTGRLLLQEALQQGLRPIIAGRNESKLVSLAQEFQVDYRIASLDDPNALDALLTGQTLVLHAAGPFEVTGKPMWDACRRNNVHYLDITGEISVFEQVKALDQAARLANIMLMPGVGFDVVPTDCIAAQLKQELPDADTLELAFVGLGGGLSHGTATTMVRHLGEGGLVRRDGKIIPSPIGALHRVLTIQHKAYSVGSIPWGDVSTAYHTTGIRNITTFTGMKPGAIRLLKWQRIFNPIIRSAWIKRLLQRKIDQSITGPTEEQLLKGRTWVWGRVSNSIGSQREMYVQVGNGYRVTALAGIHIVKRVLNGDVQPGYQTPAGCYGSDLLNIILIQP